MFEMDDLFIGLLEGYIKEIQEEANNFSRNFMSGPLLEQKIKDEHYWLQFQAERSENKSNFLDLRYYDMNKLNKLQAEGRRDGIFPMKAIYNEVIKPDVIIYAERKDMPWPLWSSIGEIRWGLQHIMTDYNSYWKDIQTKRHKKHWEEILQWCGCSEQEKFIPVLQKLSLCIQEAEKIDSRLSESEQTLLVSLANKENGLLLLVNIVLETGYIISGWLEND